MQQLIVALIVVAAVLSAAWRLMGATTRLKLLDALARRSGGAAGRWFAARAQWQRAAALTSGCAGCAAGSGGGKRAAGR